MFSRQRYCSGCCILQFLVLFTMNVFASSQAVLGWYNDDVYQENVARELNPSSPSNFGRRDIGSVRGLQLRGNGDTSKPVAGNSDHGRIVLTVLYLSVLGLCFVTPVLYYLRLYCEERAARRRRIPMETEGPIFNGQNDETREGDSGTNASTIARNLIDAVLFSSSQRSAFLGDNNSNNTDDNDHAEESRTARHKYNAERRARILQLFAPVRTILLSHNFPNSDIAHCNSRTTSVCTNSSTAGSTEGVSDTMIKPADKVVYENNDERPEQSESDIIDDTENNKNEMLDDTYSIYDEEDEENMMIEIPVPGLIRPYHVAVGEKNTMNQASQDVSMRLASGICPICLSAFKIGSDIVWSSNAACEHVFHEKCIEKWLVRQREGPLCPCCRRDFVIDPYDMEDDEVLKIVGIESSCTRETEDLEEGGGGDISTEASQESPTEEISSSPAVVWNNDGTEA